MAEFGLTESFTHPENGMIESDMRACVRVASELDEVIIFRSTGPWSRRWIKARYPTKNFHVKGKSRTGVRRPASFLTWVSTAKWVLTRRRPRMARPPMTTA